MKCRVYRHTVHQPRNKSYRLIPLTQGQNALVDAKDFYWLNKWNWTAAYDPKTKSFYAVSGKPQIKMHSFIMGCRADHKNHNTLDNRRKNLRKATVFQNNLNRRRHSSNTSGFIGVVLMGKKWNARIQFKGKFFHIGMFSDPEDAARARDKLAKKLHGRFAVLNYS